MRTRWENEYHFCWLIVVEIRIPYYRACTNVAWIILVECGKWVHSEQYLSRFQIYAKSEEFCSRTICFEWSSFWGAKSMPNRTCWVCICEWSLTHKNTNWIKLHAKWRRVTNAIGLHSKIEILIFLLLFIILRCVWALVSSKKYTQKYSGHFVIISKIFHWICLAKLYLHSFYHLCIECVLCGRLPIATLHFIRILSVNIRPHVWSSEAIRSNWFRNWWSIDTVRSYSNWTPFPMKWIAWCATHLAAAL